MAKQKYYVVWKGVTPGVYDSWAECQLQIKNVQDARYKSFESLEEAQKAFTQNPWEYFKKSAAASGKTATGKPIKESLAVDAACSGNPGVMEYRGVYTQTNEEIFHCKYNIGTNNIGEFLAIVHGLSYLKKHGLKIPIYTDSISALAWVRNKKAKTNLERNSATAELFDYVERAEKWLKENTWDTEILKWDTEHWGEIPADFGRK